MFLSVQQMTEKRFDQFQEVSNQTDSPQTDVRIRSPQESIHLINEPKQGLRRSKASPRFPPLQFLSDFIDIYRFGDRRDSVVLVLGIVLALASGVAFPLFMYYWGRQIDHTIHDYFILATKLDLSFYYFIMFNILGVGSFIVDGAVFAVWKLLSGNIAQKFRARYMESFIKMKVQWIEEQNLFEETAKFKQNCMMIEKATGDKVALFYNLIGMMMAGLTISFWVRWTMSLYMLVLIPIGMGTLGVVIYILILKKIEAKEFYEKADAKSAQAVTLIKTVKMLGAEAHQEAYYNEGLNEYLEKTKSHPMKLGVSTGLFYFIQYFIMGLGFYFGIQCARGTSLCPVSMTGSHYTVGEMHIVFFETFLCTYYFLQLVANYDAIRDAIKSSKEVYSFIEMAEQFSQEEERRVSKEVDKDHCISDIQLKHVSFAYPSQPDRKVLKDVSIKFLKNKFNAIVGATGSGKSTITQLLLKFYSADEGQVLIGGGGIQTLDADWLREKVGFVGQQPVLFSGTIRENVLVGKKDASDQQIWSALKKANLHEFVAGLPEKLEYNIGFGGLKLSGGQKQRIAIARALIKQPQVLILDEATSALDRKSEQSIQKTFQPIFLSQNLQMTVICIAHKIRTIRKADRIWYIENGEVKEQGLFGELRFFQNIEHQMYEEEEQIDRNVEQQLAPLLSISQNRQKKSKKGSKVKQQIYNKNIYLKLLSYTEHKRLYALAIITSFINGLNHPITILLLAYMYAEQVDLFHLAKYYNWCKYGFPTNCEELLDPYFNRSANYLLWIIAFAFYAFFAYYFQMYVMAKIESEITQKIRKQVFKKLMYMPVRYYETAENDGGQVAARYGLDVDEVSSLVTLYIPILITNFTTIIAGIGLCLFYLWELGILGLFTIPLIAVGGYISMLFIGGYDDKSLHKYEDSDRIASQLMIHIKTVLSLDYQHRLLEKYKKVLTIPQIVMLKQGAKIGCFFGLSMLLIQSTIGTAMYLENLVLAKIQYKATVEMVVSMVVPMWCGWISGNNFFFIAHAGSGKKSARSIFRLLEEKTEAEIQSYQVSRTIRSLPSQIKGRIEFNNVSFKYVQGQHSKYTLKTINLVIEPGQKVAFVGESGCGKSTLLMLLQRFYEYEGEITLDGVNILEYDLTEYRRYFAVVNQEPSLFTGSVRDNIVFNSNATEEQLEEACLMAHVFDANRVKREGITKEQSMDEFLQRDVGSKASKLSGGEKQRVACARAILRKPRVFLMDQGTSALDRETERKVQENIDDRLRGVTTINVAHRMETIENSDMIYLLEEGQLIESGKYSEMMCRKQHFYMFVQGRTLFQENNQQRRDLIQ